jgi:hypothetical protein
MPAGPRAGRHRRRAFLGLLLLALVVPPSHASAATREYGIQADELMWDVAPKAATRSWVPRSRPPSAPFMATVYHRYTSGRRKLLPDTAVTVGLYRVSRR